MKGGRNEVDLRFPTKDQLSSITKQELRNAKSGYKIR